MFHFKVAGREQSSRAALGRYAVKVFEAVVFPGKYNAVARIPLQLRLGHHFMKRATWARLGVPNLMCFARV